MDVVRKIHQYLSDDEYFPSLLAQLLGRSFALMNGSTMELPSSYSRWKTFGTGTDAQRKKLRGLLAGMFDEEREAIFLRVNTQKGLNLRTTTHNSTVNERARVAHLFVDSDYSNLWIKTTNQLSRQEVDDKGREDPWDALTAAFNNFEELFYSNVTQSKTAGISRRPDPQYANIWSVCQHIDPSDALQGQRTSTWLKERVREMKSEYTTALANFNA